MIVYVSDRESAAHLAKAIATHARWARTNQIPLPPELLALAESLLKQSTAAQGGSEPDGFAGLADTDEVNAPLLLSLRQAGQLLGCSLSSVKRLIEAGELEAVKVNGIRKVRRTDVDEYIASLPPVSFRDRIEQKATPADVPANRPPAQPDDGAGTETAPGPNAQRSALGGIPPTARRSAGSEGGHSPRPTLRPAQQETR